MKRLNLNIPIDLHNRIKVQCAMKGLNMTEVLVTHLDRLFPPMSVTMKAEDYARRPR